MNVLLIGASPLGSRALVSLGLPYHAMLSPQEDCSELQGNPSSILRVPYDVEPTRCLDYPPPAGTSAVLSFAEAGLLAASIYGEAFGLSCVPLVAVLRSRHKGVMRRVLAAAGLGLPSGMLDTSQPAAEDYPVIVKPATGTASQDIALIADPQQLHDRTFAPGSLWEQFRPGAEFSVETITCSGVHEVLGITEKLTSGSPYFVEIGHRAPADLDYAASASITGATLACLDAIGLTRGPAHTEVIWDGVTATVVETHTRPGGDRVPRITELVSGRNQHLEAVQALLPQLAVSRPPAPHRTAGVRFLQWPEGRLTDLRGVEHARAVDGVDEVVLSVQPGAEIETVTCSARRPGHIVATGVDAAQLNATLSAAERCITATIVTDLAIERAGRRSNPIPVVPEQKPRNIVSPTPSMALRVSDIDRSRDFYVDALEFEVVDATDRCAFTVRCPDGDLLLIADHSAGDLSPRLADRHAVYEPGETLVFADADIDSVRQTLTANDVPGAKHTTTAWASEIVRLTDPDGYKWKWVSRSTLTDEQLLDLYATAPDRLRQALAGITADELQALPEGYTWTARMLVHHICDGDQLWAGAIMAALVKPGTAYSHDWYTTDLVAAQQLDYTTREIDTAVALFELNRRHTVELARMPGALDRSIDFRRHYEANPAKMTLRSILLGRAIHTIEHIDELVSLRAQIGRTAVSA